MAEEKASKIGGWLKAGLTSILGVFSGAVLMYVSPLVNSAVRPSKPVANFGQQIQGLTVTFQNRSIGGSDGTWDFGDGSLMEPFSPNQEAVTHSYAHSGTFIVKLKLRNFVGDENERAVTVNLDGSSTNPPAIEAFKVVPVSAAATAPATFHIVSQVKNADQCIWSLGDDRPLEISTVTSPSLQRYVTLSEPGYYTLRLVALSGSRSAEKSESVFVSAGDASIPAATLQVTYQAVQVEHKTMEVNLPQAFPAESKENSYAFSAGHTEPGYQIIEAKFARPATPSFVKNPKLTIDPDKSRVVLTGELVKPSGIMSLQKNQRPLHWIPTVNLTLEHRSPPKLKASDPIVVDLNVPGSTVLPWPKLSGGWEVQSKTINLELRDGANIVFKDSKLPAGVVVPIKNRPYRVTATPGPDSIRLDLVDAKATLRPI